MPPTIRLPTRVRLPYSRIERLDAARDPQALHLRARRATRRLSTSAIDTIREHNRRMIRAPQNRSVVAHVAAILARMRAAGGSAILSNRFASRGFTGQGPMHRDAIPMFPAPPIAIARNGSFAPTRSARAPLVAISCRIELERSIRWARPPKGRLTRSSAKRSAIRRTRGAFHRRMDPWGPARSPPIVPNLWIRLASAFSFSMHPNLVTYEVLGVSRPDRFALHSPS